MSKAFSGKPPVKRGGLHISTVKQLVPMTPVTPLEEMNEDMTSPVREGADADEAVSTSSSGASNGTPTPVADTLMIGSLNVEQLQEQLKQERIRLREFIVKAKEEYEEHEEKRRAMKVVEAESAKDDGSHDDPQGYYKTKLGEKLEGERYKVLSHAGRGVFSSVAKCRDRKRNIDVAIKIIRSNDMMRKAAKKETGFLHKLNAHDKQDRQHVVRLYRTFEHRGHMCMVFELLWNDLRYALKKYGQKGLSMGAVWSYSRQLFISLRYIRKNGIVHGDLKPDNILIDKQFKSLKLADLGSATGSTECDITSYFVSRFYRPPEICLGLPYDYPIDMWSAGCTLYELFTGKIMFPGASNNDMLKLHQELMGKMSPTYVKHAMYRNKHFELDGTFIHRVKDRKTKKETITKINDLRATRTLDEVMFSRVPETDEYKKEKAGQLLDLILKCVDLDPTKRITPEEALQHPWIKDGYQSSYGQKDKDTGVASATAGSKVEVAKAEKVA